MICGASACGPMDVVACPRVPYLAVTSKPEVFRRSSERTSVLELGLRMRFRVSLFQSAVAGNRYVLWCQSFWTGADRADPGGHHDYLRYQLAGGDWAWAGRMRFGGSPSPPAVQRHALQTARCALAE